MGVQEILVERKDTEGERKEGMGGGRRRKGRSKEDTRKAARERGRREGERQGAGRLLLDVILTSLPSFSCPRTEP